MELWAGLECSVVRVGDTWRDQVRETGHHDRAPRDLDLLTELGIRTLRYPFVWERLTPGQAGACGWGWHDRRLADLERRGLRVLAGLLHHGSGPRWTSLADPDFPARFARFAARAAARYPQVADWVPINEPLTTARFSFLYGHWYPHKRNEGAFLRAVAHQAYAALLAIRAIRARNPSARFIHTEDIGRVFATAPLARQAAYENDRRWLSLDLLCGRLGPDHPWHGWLLRHGVPPRQLDELATGEAAPDLIGVNHYVTSDRFLDHRTALYPPHLRGGNGHEAYADTEAVRADLPPAEIGWLPRLREVAGRYARPMAITEAHLGCDDPEEQVRWLMEAWDAACALRAEGAAIEAVTAWALFGLVDWDCMLRERRGAHEPGALGPEGGRPLLAAALRALARDGAFSHPSLGQPGWWRRRDRVHPALRRRA